MTEDGGRIRHPRDSSSVLCRPSSVVCHPTPEEFMPRHLKRGMDASAIKAADAKVRETVEHILADIDARKDVAVRELSQKFDSWAPASFKLTSQEIERVIGAMKKRDLDDIKFAQARVRTFAQKQKETRRDLEATPR